MAPTFALLTLAIVALWLDAPGRPLACRHAWWIAFVAATIAGLWTGIVDGLGLLAIASFAFVVWRHQRGSRSAVSRTATVIALLGLAGGLMTHLLPGFHNPRVIDALRLTPDALPYRLHFNFDKTAAGLLLVALLHPRLRRYAELTDMLRRTLPVLAATFAVLMGGALAAGYVRFAPKFPPEAPLFLWANLCLTCLAEEALFRGFIQAGLTRAWGSIRHGTWLALGVAALLFGLGHAAGGPTYVALSTLAGVGYGLAYQRSGGRIEASILTHFAVNSAHFLGFTYPALQR